MSEGQRPEIAQLVVDHQTVLYRYAYRLCGNSFDADDLTQQTYLLAHANLRQLRDPAGARSWLCAILRNCYLKSFRRWAPAPETDVGTSLAHLPQHADELPIDGERLQAALDELPAEFKVVLLMFYFEDCSYREIAEQLQLPLGTVMSRLSRAKQHLRNRLLESELHTSARGGRANREGHDATR
jgi:RNA polymerase sigma-70 factor (ECF subfamily)